MTTDLHDPGEPPAGWPRLGDLIESPGRLDARVESVRVALERGYAGEGRLEVRVAASVAHLGIVARILAVDVAGRALRAEPFSLGLDVRWQDVLGGPVPLSCPRGPGPRGLDADSAAAVLTSFASARYGLGDRVAWGNVASGLNSAARVIGVARPGLAESARRAADDLLADPRVEGGALRAGPAFRRQSCCLIYRVAGSRDAVCGDCVLARGATVSGRP